MDKAINRHFKKLAKSPQEKKLLKRVLSDDKKLDRAIDRDQKKKKNGK